jgi:DNA-binding response OmpR family regulator
VSVAPLPVRPDPPSTVTVTIDLTVGSGGLSPAAQHLLALLRQVADGPRGAGRVTSLRVASAAEGVVVVRAGAREVAVDGAPVRLTRLEYDLLLFLARHPRQVFTRAQLLRNVWGYEHAVERTVDVHVRRLRGKLGAHANVVTTVFGVGYRLSDEAEVTVLPAG